MGRSNGRDLYFTRYIEPARTPEEYMEALKKSPYRTHRRMAALLKPQYDELNNQKNKGE